MYCLSAFCFVCLSMDKKKKLSKISDLSIFRMLNSCSYDTNWMEDAFTMHVCRKCHNQLYSVYEFIEMCRKNSSLLQGYVALLKHRSNDIGEPIDRLKEREMVKMEVVIDLDTVENKLKDDRNVNMTSAHDTSADPIRELSLKDELDADMYFMNATIDIKHEPVILKSEIDYDSPQVLDQMMEFDAETDSKQDLVFQSAVNNHSEDKRDQETSIRNEKHRIFCFADGQFQTANETPSICKHIKIEHIRDQNEILVTNVLDEGHNIKTQFSSHSDSIYINNIIENNAVQNELFNKVNLPNPTDPIERMCDEMQQRENDQNFKIKLPVLSNVNGFANVCLVQNGAAAQNQPNELSLYTENSLNHTICAAQNNKVESAGFGLKRVNKMSSDYSAKRKEYNRKVKKTKKGPDSTDTMFYIMLPMVPPLSIQPIPNIPVMETVPSVDNNVDNNADNSIQNGIPIAATNNVVQNYKRKLEPPRKCDICQKTCDTHADLRLHLVTHSGMKTVTPEKTLMEEQRKQMGINKKETYETMFIKHMVKTGSL